MGVTRVFLSRRNELRKSIWKRDRHNNVRAAIFMSIVKLAQGLATGIDVQAPCPTRPRERLSAAEARENSMKKFMVLEHAVLCAVVAGTSKR